MKTPPSLLSRRVVFACAAMGMALSLTVWAAERPNYSITAIKPPPGWTAVLPSKINDAGTIIGTAEYPLFQRHSFIYENGMMREFMPEDNGEAIDINNLGQILGFVGTFQQPVPIVVNPNGTILNLAQSVGPAFYPIRINDGGDVLGYNYDGITIYNINTGARRILKEPRPLSLYDLNNQGDVVAIYTPQASDTINGVLFDAGRVTELFYPGAHYTEPLFINNHEEVVGIAVNPTEDQIWRGITFIFHNGKFRAIEPLPGDQQTSPTGVNDRGDVIGVSINNFGGFIHPYLFRNHKTTDLNSFIPAGSGWLMDQPQAINNNGQVVGTGRFEGEGRGFLLTPVEHGRMPAGK